MKARRTRSKSTPTSSGEAVDIGRLAEAFQALAHPHRLRIFVRLAACCRADAACGADARTCVSELGRGLGIAASTLSHHLKTLRTAGLVRVEKCGQSCACWVDPGTLARLAHFFSESMCKALCR